MTSTLPESREDLYAFESTGGFQRIFINDTVNKNNWNNITDIAIKITNIKFDLGLFNSNIWELVNSTESSKLFFNHILHNLNEVNIEHMKFLRNLLSSFEVPLIRDALSPLCFIELWEDIPISFLKYYVDFTSHPKLRKLLTNFIKKGNKNNNNKNCSSSIFHKICYNYNPSSLHSIYIDIFNLLLSNHMTRRFFLPLFIYSGAYCNYSLKNDSIEYFTKYFIPPHLLDLFNRNARHYSTNFRFKQSSCLDDKSLNLLDEKEAQDILTKLNVDNDKYTGDKLSLLKSYLSYYRGPDLIEYINGLSLHHSDLIDNDGFKKYYEYVSIKEVYNLYFLNVTDYLLRNFFLYYEQSVESLKNLIIQNLVNFDPEMSIFCSKVDIDNNNNLSVLLHEQSGRIIQTKKYLYAYFEATTTTDFNDFNDLIKPYDPIYLLNVKQIKEISPNEILSINANNLFDFFTIDAFIGGDVVRIEYNDGDNNWSTDQNQVSSKERRVYISTEEASILKEIKFNMILRRPARESNPATILNSICSLLNTADISVPNWLHDAILGIKSNSSNTLNPICDLYDTIVDNDHFLQCLNTLNIQNTTPMNFNPNAKYLLSPNNEIIEKEIIFPKLKNTVKFTPTQFNAIVKGNTFLNKVTLINGPPGTGKTDTVVQLVSTIYHSSTEDKILILAHSNQALNDIFEKISKLNISESDLVRLGRGESELIECGKFSCEGRVKHALELRLNLLSDVAKYCQAYFPSVNATDVSYNCFNADHFYHSHVKGSVHDSDSAKALFKNVKKIQPFEKLTTPSQRRDFILTTYSRIVAMTCTYALLNRHRFVQDLNLTFENIVMEEASLMTEVECFVPLVLQKHGNNLQRVCLVGDRMQLPPIVLEEKDNHSQVIHRSDQSLFVRLQRLHKSDTHSLQLIELDLQGRCRPEIANLFNWVYPSLGNMNHVLNFSPKFNPGFVYTTQFIHVEGGIESCPKQFYYQNIAEAEYILSVYQFMTEFLKYDPSKITILSTYNGQVDLLYELARKRHLSSITKRSIFTVDKFQGQQNDYILLSLVRTSSIGHFRDIRRVSVAVSRGRLGLYCFGNVHLFSPCSDLFKLFEIWPKSYTLDLVPNEDMANFNTQRENASGFSIHHPSQLFAM